MAEHEHAINVDSRSSGSCFFLGVEFFPGHPEKMPRVIVRNRMASLCPIAVAFLSSEVPPSLLRSLA
jgi:hypothetical protein